MATKPDLVYFKTAERPALGLWLFDDDGDLLDFTGVTTFEFKIGFLGQTAVLTKTSGITGAAGSGTGAAQADVPNVLVTPAADEFDNVEPDLYRWQLRETASDRIYQGFIKINDVIL